VTRKIFDCRELPGNCTLTISGEEDEVIRVQAAHAVSVHGETNTPELRELIRSSLKEEPSARRPLATRRSW
jgi:predicted small metal-binding protein